MFGHFVLYSLLIALCAIIIMECYSELVELFGRKPSKVFSIITAGFVRFVSVSVGISVLFVAFLILTGL